MSRYFLDGVIRRNNEQRYVRKHPRSVGEASPPRPPRVDYNEERHPGRCEREERTEKTDRENLENIEKRRRYVATVLERYYSHPSNRYHSMPSSLRKQFVDSLATSGKEKERGRTDNADLVNGGICVDDSASDISSLAIRSAATTPDPSFYYDDEENVHSSTLNEYDTKRRRKSRFFRSSSIRSLKKLMKKLGGSRSRSRPSTDPGMFASGFAPSHDSGLETPSDTSVNYNTTNLQVRNRSPESANGYRQVGAANGADIPTPALCGIVNHGNTCYINAVIQCLSNTDLLAEYFLSGRYLIDLNNNLRNADRYGSHGNVTLALAEFLKALWFNKYSSDISLRFKSLVERYSEQYRGNQQQDAQEFFYWLSDRVHEDLNVAIKRRYKLHKTGSKNEDELATAAMEKHLEAHNSFLSARFHGLFLSSVTCPTCGRHSTKPDPFMCISLPVSQSTKRPLFVVIVFHNRQPRQVRFGLNADVTATFREVKKCLADATGVNADNLILCDVDDRGFQSTLLDQNEVITLGTTKCIWAFETPSTYGAVGDEELILLVGNQSRVSRHRFGSFVALKVHREVSYGDLCRSILLALRPQLRHNTSIQDIPLTAFHIRVVDDYRPLVYVPQDVALPLYTQVVDNALTGMNYSTSAFHLKVMLEWQRTAKENYFASFDDQAVDHVSAQDLRDQEERPEIQSLGDCLAEYTRPESCQWHCPDCRRRQDNAVKRIVLYWLPDVLVLHLKRFKQQSNGQLVKLEGTVWFPVNELDLTEFTYRSIYQNQKQRNMKQRTPSGGSYRTTNGGLYVDSRRNENLYDLYAVCNHSGYSPHSGHYTAYCRNPINGRWYCFDDQSVTPMRERDVVTNAAYLLFYERRQAGRCNNGQHSSTESGFVDHWYFRLFSQNGRRNSCSSKDTLDDGSPTDHQRKLVSTKENVEPAAMATSTPTSVQKLYVKLPGIEEAKRVKQPCERDPRVNEKLVNDEKKIHAWSKQTNGTGRQLENPADGPKKTIFLPNLHGLRHQASNQERLGNAKQRRENIVESQDPQDEQLLKFEEVGIPSAGAQGQQTNEEKSNGLSKQLEEDFSGFNSIALPSCAKMLTTGVAAPVLTNGYSPSLSTSSHNDRLSLRRVRTCSTVETDL